MRKYFRLFEECLLIDGYDEKYSIYNLLTGDVFQLNEKETSIILLCEKKKAIKDISVEVKIDLVDIMKFLDKLKNNDLGFYTENILYIEKMFMDHTWLDFTFLEERPVVSRAFLILEAMCNNNCYHCNGDYIRKKSCFGCFRPSNSNNSTTVDEYYYALDKLKQMDVKEIYITGGDIFLNFERNIEILKYASTLGFDNIFVYIGGNRRIDDDKIKMLEELNIHLFLQIMIEDENSLIENKLINCVLKKDKYSLLLLFKDIDNVDLCKKIIKQSQKLLSPLQIFVDYVIKKDHIDIKAKRILHTLSKTSFVDYSNKIRYNQCMYGTMTITNDSNISICPRMGNNPIGKIKNFNTILTKNNTDKYWRLTKDKLEKCNGCNLRYICDDCRFIEYSLSKNILASETCPK